MSEVKDIGLTKIALSVLNVRYIPVVTPIKLWHYDMLLKNSPHVELMQIFATSGFDWTKIKTSRYYKERAHRFAIGIEKWTMPKIRSHIKDRYKIFKSMNVAI